MNAFRSVAIGLVRAAAIVLVPLGIAFAADFDFSPDQAGRPHAKLDSNAVAALPKGYKFVQDDVLTVAIVPFAPPISTYATDAKTVVGADADIASLVAESFGLRLDLHPIACGLAARPDVGQI
jgi:polar amino acid transport system substrate-binding protein